MNFINMSLKKITIFILLLLWIIFSIAYIILDQIGDFKVRQLAQAYDSGYEQGTVDAGQAILQQATTCSPFSVTLDGQKVELINTSCLSDDTIPESSN